MLLIDFSQIVFGMLINQHGRNKTVLKDSVLTRLIDVIMAHSAPREKVVICCDQETSWRSKVFPNYKALRRIRQMNDRHFELIVEVAVDLIKELRTHSPWVVISVDQAEADDVIATLVMYTSEPIKIISSDRDFIQLHRWGHVQQFAPFGNKLIEDDGEHAIEEKVLNGDKGDGIPNVLSHDDVFIKNVSQTRLVKSLRAQLGDKPGKDDILRVIPEHFAKYVRNRSLIDLTRTPQYLRNQIMHQFQTASPGDDLAGYIKKSRLVRSQTKVGAYRAFQRFGAVQSSVVSDHC